MRETLAMRMCSAAVCIDPVYLMDNGVNVSQLHNWFFTEITHTHKIGTQQQRETIRSTEKKRTRRGDNVDYCFHPFFFHFCFFFFYRALVNAVCVQKCLLWKLAVKCLIGLNPFDKTSKNLSAMYFFFFCCCCLSVRFTHSLPFVAISFMYVWLIVDRICHSDITSFPIRWVTLSPPYVGLGQTLTRTHHSRQTQRSDDDERSKYVTQKRIARLNPFLVAGRNVEILICF